MKNIMNLRSVTTVCFLLLILTGCTNKGPLLQGRWEMFVGKDPSLIGQEYGVDNLTYCMELDFSKRSFEPYSELPSGKASYGYMDFSTMARIYHYDIDSVAYIGNNKFRVVSTMDDPFCQLSIDTLTYNPKTKEIIYNANFKFKYVSGIRPFVGEWEAINTDNDAREYIKLNLYQEMKAPDEYPLNGKSCYGYIIYDSDIHLSHKIITSVLSANASEATVMTVFPDFPEEKPYELHLSYNWNDGSLSIDNCPAIPNKNGIIAPDVTSASKVSSLSEIGKWIFILAIILITSIILLNVLDIEGAIRFWLPAVALSIMSILICFIINDIFFYGAEIDYGAKGVLNTLKLYGAFILITGSFLFALLNIFFWTEDNGYSFNRTPLLMFGIFATILPAMVVFLGTQPFDTMLDRFLSSLTNHEGTISFIMALLVAGIGISFIIQWCILAASIKGGYRIVVMIMFPIWAVAGVALVFATVVALTYLAIFAAIIYFVITFLSASRDSLSKSNSNSPLSDFLSSGNNSQNESNHLNDEFDHVVKGGGVLGGDVKAKDTSFFKDGSEFQDENGTEYKKRDDGKFDKVE